MFVAKEVAFARLDICAECPRLFKPTFTCRECGCFMKAKVRLAGNIACPLGKWGPTEKTGDTDE